MPLATCSNDADIYIYATSARLKGRGNQDEHNDGICNKRCKHHDVGEALSSVSFMLLCLVVRADLDVGSNAYAQHNPEEGCDEVSKVYVVGFNHGGSWE